MLTFTQWVETTRVTIYTSPQSKGAMVDDTFADEPVQMLDIDSIINYERASKMDLPASRENMQKILAGIKAGEKMPPVYVREVKLKGKSNPRWDGNKMLSVGGVPNSRFKYQIIDGHHRYWAYKKAGVKTIPAIVVSPEDIQKKRLWTPEDEY
jgi:hypothetical protein